MRAAVLEQGELRLRDVPDPAPSRGEVRVAVAAAALNRADLLQKRGLYPPPGPKQEHEIPGLEFAGTVELGTGEFRAGDRVMGLVGAGGQAEKLVTHERLLLRVPEGMPFVEAAAIPEVFFTAWDALALRAEMRPGDAVLVHAAGSGVGTAAVQVAKLLGASRVMGTSRTPEKIGRLRAMGVEEPGPADVILNLLGAATIESDIRLANECGRIVLIGLLGGDEAKVPLLPILRKRLRIVGTTIRQRALEEKMALTQRFAREVLPHFPAKLRPVVDRTFRFDEIAEAYRYLESNRSFGKVVVTLETRPASSAAGP
jgi:NADPH:quinone reductase-like Zn-dependent oxidoreductase